VSSWINVSALWKIVVFGLLAGAGLPAIYAIGMVILSRTRTVTVTGNSSTETRKVAGLAAAGFCFLIVLTAIGWGIYEIYRTGHK
jgi:hypothetical protein